MAQAVKQAPDTRTRDEMLGIVDVTKADFKNMNKPVIMELKGRKGVFIMKRSYGGKPLKLKIMGAESPFGVSDGSYGKDKTGPANYSITLKVLKDNKEHQNLADFLDKFDEDTIGVLAEHSVKLWDKKPLSKDTIRDTIYSKTLKQKAENADKYDPLINLKLRTILDNSVKVPEFVLYDESNRQMSIFDPKTGMIDWSWGRKRTSYDAIFEFDGVYIMSNKKAYPTFKVSQLRCLSRDPNQICGFGDEIQSIPYGGMMSNPYGMMQMGYGQHNQLASGDDYNDGNDDENEEEDVE